jgi:N-acetyl-anhydromuramyl-L-alanine amidase AmpD
MKLYWKPSKGYGSRHGYPIDFVVLHYTWGKKAGDLNTLCSRRASSHFYITKEGDIYWLVPLDKRAYHAGIVWTDPKTWQYDRWKRIRPNERSIGIEIEGYGNYTEEQYSALAWLLPLICGKYGIPIKTLDDPWFGSEGRAACDVDVLEAFRGILGHCSIHFSKVDPGPNFEWDRVKALGPLPQIAPFDRAASALFFNDPGYVDESGVRIHGA